MVFQMARSPLPSLEPKNHQTNTSHSWIPFFHVFSGPHHPMLEAETEGRCTSTEYGLVGAGCGSVGAATKMESVH